MSQASLYTILNNVTTKTYVIITIYNTQQCNHQNLCHRHHYIQYSDTIHCNHQNLCHRHHYIQYSGITKTYVTGITYTLNNVTTKTYVTGITIYNTLTRFIVTTKTYVTGITIYNTQQCNHQNLCHRHHYLQYSTM